MAGTRTFHRWAWGGLVTGFAVLPVGCAGFQSPIATGAFIRNPIAPPAPTPPGPTPPELPTLAPAEPDIDKKLQAIPVSTTGPLELGEVLATVNQNFPLLQAVQEERGIAIGQRVAAEGAFDLNLRGTVNNNEGSYGNTRLDFVAEQASPVGGLTTFAGYRMGLGDYPVYNLGQKTAQGGEFRAGVILPLLRDGPIDRRRAALRQAQIAEQLADPIIRRARLDFLRNSARAYWLWVASGERYTIQLELLKLANDRQQYLGFLKESGKRIGEIPVNDNLRAIYERRELVLAAERGLQEAAILLSVFLCDANGNPVIPSSDRLPKDFRNYEPPEVSVATIDADVATALEARPEIERLRLQREQLAVELKLALNQFLPAVNVGASVAQDMGFSSKSFTGTDIFRSDRSAANVFLTSDIPVQRREAQGRAQQTRARLVQLVLQEKQFQNVIRAEVQDAVSTLIQAKKRLDEARKERAAATNVVDYETILLKNDLTDVFILNGRELNAAAANIKIALLLAEYFRAYADYRAAVADEAGMVPPLRTLPTPPAKPGEKIPPPKPLPMKVDPPK